MPPSKDRQNSGISVAEAEQAAEHLNAAIWKCMDPSAVLVEIRAAMAILCMKEVGRRQ